jgi:cellulose synthase/poly-beta-1,6-N-acetylglucosamine synthase-like glycosyltransferase
MRANKIFCKHAKGVSVVIPTYKDTNDLIRCIKSIYSQNIQQDLLEVIVVNNNPYDNLLYLSEIFKGLIILNERKVGSYAARNTGIARSKKDIVAFTDADCIPDRNWIKNALSYFNNHSNCAIIGGKILKYFINNGSPSTIELYDSLSFHQQEKYISKYHFSVTANMFVRKEVFDGIGKFDSNLKSGGDSEFGNRAWKYGYQICYVASVLVKHQAVNSLNKLIGKMKRVAGGKYQKDNFQNLSTVVFLVKILKSFNKSINAVFQIRNQIGYDKFIKLILLDMLIQLIVITEYISLKMGSKPIRGY